MLSQAVGYAAVAMGYLASHPEGTALIRTMADDCEIPAPYLSKIVNQLARAGLVKTQRGVGGGVRLARDPGEVTLYHLCTVLGDPAIEHKCMLGATICSDNHACPAHGFNQEHRSRLIDFLRKTTVAEIGDYNSSSQAG